MRYFAGAAFVCGALLHLSANSQVLESPAKVVRLEISGRGRDTLQIISVKDRDSWKTALPADGAIHVVALDATSPQTCTIESSAGIQNPAGILVRGSCEALGTFERRMTTSSKPDVIDVTVRFAVQEHAKVRSVEDRYDFSPPRRSSDTPLSGPLDFIWSQNIKSEPDDLVPDWCFKSPVVMMQQGRVFAALMPVLRQRQRVPLAFDLDTVSAETPWLSYGAVDSEPHGHSYFRRSITSGPQVLAGFVEYSYSIVAGAQPEKLGYQRVIHRLWEQLRSSEPDVLARSATQCSPAGDFAF